LGEYVKLHTLEHYLLSKMHHFSFCWCLNYFQYWKNYYGIFIFPGNWRISL